MMGGRLDYRSRMDMQTLAKRVATYGPSSELCAFIVDQDLMRPQWWVRLAFWVVKKRHGHTLHLWERLSKVAPGMQSELINGTVAHILCGKDLTTRDAAGGLNQTEVDKLVYALDCIKNWGKAA